MMITEIKQMTKELLCEHDFVIEKTFVKGEFKRNILKCSSCGKRVSTSWIKYPDNVIFLKHSKKEIESTDYKHQSQ